MTNAAVTVTDAVSWRRHVQLSEARLTFHHVLTRQTFNPLIQAVWVICTQSVTQYDVVY